MRGTGRLALVIGNARYAIPLANPLKDARDTAALLGTMGFTVVVGEDLDQLRLERAIRKFGDQLAKEGGTGLFYYSGHGVQVDGENYLVPVGARIEREDEVRGQAVEVDLVLRKMQSAGNGTNIVILDACRDNPFRGMRSSRRGLATMEAPAGTFISYATAPGSVAADGTPGRNGLYTGYLLEVMRTPGLLLETIFKLVRQRVIKATGGRQVPWDSSSLEGDFYFVPPLATGPPPCPSGTHREGERCVPDVSPKIKPSDSPDMATPSANVLAPASAVPSEVAPPPAPGGPVSPPDRDLPLPGEREFTECVRLRPNQKIVVSLRPDSNLEDLVAWWKTISCRTFIVPANLTQKKVTLIIPEAITVEEAYHIFLGALESIGLTVLADRRVLRIVELNRQSRSTGPNKKEK